MSAEAEEAQRTAAPPPSPEWHRKLRASKSAVEPTPDESSPGSMVPIAAKFDEPKESIVSDVPAPAAAKLIELLSAAKRCTETEIDALGQDLVEMIPDASKAEALARIGATRGRRAAPLPMPELVPLTGARAKVKPNPIYMDALKSTCGL